MQSSNVDSCHMECNENISSMDLVDQSTVQQSPQSVDQKKRRRRGKKRRVGRSIDSGISERKRYSPKAPENYTQYLLEDQKNSCVDVNSNTDLCLSSFLKAQFENDFSEARATELAQKSKSELTTLICELESKRSRLMKHHCYCSECDTLSAPAAEKMESSSSECDIHDRSFTTSSSDSDADVSNDWTTTLGTQLAALERENTRLKKEKEKLDASVTLH